MGLARTSLSRPLFQKKKRFAPSVIRAVCSLGHYGTPKPFWLGIGTATFILGAASGPLQVVVVNPSQIESNEAVIPFGRQAEHGLLPIASSYLDSSEPATPKVESVSSTL